jgi:hypothetical protein
LLLAMRLIPWKSKLWNLEASIHRTTSIFWSCVAK